MGSKRNMPEEIVTKLQQVEVLYGVEVLKPSSRALQICKRLCIQVSYRHRYSHFLIETTLFSLSKRIAAFAQASIKLRLLSNRSDRA